MQNKSKKYEKNIVQREEKVFAKKARPKLQIAKKGRPKWQNFNKFNFFLILSCFFNKIRYII